MLQEFLRKIIGSDDFTSDEKLLALGLYTSELQPSTRVDEDSDCVQHTEIASGNGVSNNLHAPEPSDLMSRKQVAEHYNYSDSWIDGIASRYPNIVHRYEMPVTGERAYSAAEIDAYLEMSGSTPRPRNGVAKKRPGNIEAISSPHASAEEMVEFDSLSRASERTGVSKTTITRWIESGEIHSYRVEMRSNSYIIVSANEIMDRSSRHGQQGYHARWELLEDKLWQPLTYALDALGIPNEAGMTPTVSDACQRGEIANRKIGSLRFVLVRDLKRWYMNH